MSKKYKIITILVISLVVILVGVSYAYFSAQLTGNESSTTVTVSGGTISLAVAGGNSITVSNTYPQTSAIATKTITVTGNNTTDLIVPYTLNLIVDSNTFGSSSIKYTLTSTNTSNNGTVASSVSTQTAITTGASTVSLGNGNFKKGTSSVHTYILNIYYPDSGSSQNTEQGKSFTAHISVTAGVAQSPTLLNTKILGTSNANVSTTLTTPGQAISTSGEAVLASATDDYGTSYYYRGAVNNNYIVFANMCWRIVRVTGDSNIKLVLYNYNPNNVSNPCNTSEDSTTAAFARYSGTTYLSNFNSGWQEQAYLGFMYGDSGGSTYAATYINTNKSQILTNLETWYSTYLSTYSSYLADTIWCNDKSISSTDAYGTYGDGELDFKAQERLSASSPSLICPNDVNGGSLSKYTVDDTTKGNGDLTYKIGLLTADEVTYAGGMISAANSTYYLYKNASGTAWDTITPRYYSYTYSLANMFVVNTGGGLYSSYTVTSGGLRPAISLISSTKVIGSGTVSDPYVVQ